VEAEVALLYWVLKWFVFLPLIRVLFRPWITGREHVPSSGPAILVANHISAGDTYLLPALIPRKLLFPAKAEAFEGRGLRGRVLKWFLEGVGMLPMDRSGGRASATSMTSVFGVLERGELLGIFPEGTRSPDGRLHKGKTGVARLVLQARVPVIPVGMVDTQFVRLPVLRIPVMRRPGVRIGTPLYFDRYAGAGNDRDVLRWVTDEIMAAVQQLSGQTYVDAYAASVKDAAREGRDFSAKVVARPGEGRPVPPVPAPVPPVATDATP
jgi:1-acyl-sn-glycerol-3-phosphate acyltransferase